jgi:hypothetical protein
MRRRERDGVPGDREKLDMTQSAHPRIGHSCGLDPQNSVGLASAYEERECSEHGYRV